MKLIKKISIFSMIILTSINILPLRGRVAAFAVGTSVGRDNNEYSDSKRIKDQRLKLNDIQKEIKKNEKKISDHKREMNKLDKNKSLDPQTRETRRVEHKSEIAKIEAEIDNLLNDLRSL